jgi:hypothetical protein
MQVIDVDRLELVPTDLRPGALLLAVDASTLSDETIEEFAEQCLLGPLEAVVCWGPHGQRVELMFDRVAVRLTIAKRRPLIESTTLLTWHEEDALEDAFLMFRLQAADCPTPHVALVVGNPEWADELKALSHEP